MNKLFRYGGIAASVVLIAFGIGAVVIGIDGRDQVRSDLARERIVGCRDGTRERAQLGGDAVLQLRVGGDGQGLQISGQALDRDHAGQGDLLQHL